MGSLEEPQAAISSAVMSASNVLINMFLSTVVAGNNHTLAHVARQWRGFP